eukprot:2518615-Amphidinium_carterae.1
MGRSVHQHTRDRPDESGTNSKRIPDERAVTRKGSNIWDPERSGDAYFGPSARPSAIRMPLRGQTH